MSITDPDAAQAGARYAPGDRAVRAWIIGAARSQFRAPLFALMAMVGAAAADRLREHRQPPAGARHQPAARDGGAPVDWRQPRTHHQPAADRKPAARHARRHRRPRDRAARQRAAGAHDDRRRHRPAAVLGRRRRRACSAFTAAITLLTSFLFGFAPAWRATDLSLSGALKASGRGTHHGARLSLSKMLVVAQVALSLLLAVGAGVFARSFSNLASLPLGFEPHVLWAPINPSVGGYQRSRSCRRSTRASSSAPKRCPAWSRRRSRCAAS